MSIADVAMVGRMGTEALAATGMGSMMFWGALSLTMGIRTAVQTVTARRLGQNLYKESGFALRNGLVLASAYSIPTSIFVWFYSHNIVQFFIKDSVATPLTVDYVSILFIGLMFSSYSFVFQGFFTGIEKTKVHMKVTITSNILNVYLNAGFIYGSSEVRAFFIEHLPSLSFFAVFWDWFNFPALGVKGAAVATLISSVWMTAHYATSLLSKEIKQKFSIFEVSFNQDMMVKQIKLALPQGLQEFVIALSGSFDVLLDDGKKKKIFSLNRSYHGLFIPKMVWRSMENFSTNALCFILASSSFDENDYIRDYNHFINIKNL